MKNKVILIGLVGPSGSGKTMLAKTYLKKMEFQVFSIQEELFDFAKSFRGISRETLDEKQRDVTQQKLGGRTPREFLRDIDEIGRKYSEGRLCWIESLWEKKLRNLPPETLVVIHDVNHKNEADFIKSKDGFLIEINRKGYENYANREFSSFSFDKTLLPNNNVTPQDIEKFAYEVAEWAKKWRDEK